MKAIIPAAGHGTRFLPVTRVVPKEMLPIGARPALEVIVEEARAAGADASAAMMHAIKIAVSFFLMWLPSPYVECHHPSFVAMIALVYHQHCTTISCALKQYLMH